MRIVERPDGLVEAVASARHEAASAFGDDTVFVEKYVVRPRHIEVQVMADGHGNVVALYERECSIQRRHQKVIEESPSSAVDADLRHRLCEAGVAAARAVDYRGAGTVEFVLAADGTFAFLEMNTRLQVEHPVTELVTGLDLVRLQIDVAAGRPLPPAALSPVITGHAIEARLYAEDVPAGYLPTTGTVSAFEIDAPDGIRVDSSISAGSVLSSQYDSMLAKVIAWAPSRDECAQLLGRSLRRSRVAGATTNLALLVNVLEDEDFRAGRFSTAFLDEKRSEMLAPLVPPEERTAAVVAAALAEAASNRASATVQRSIPAGWRNNRATDQRRQFLCEGETVEVAYRDPETTSTRVVVDGDEHALLIHTCTPDFVDVALDGVRRRSRVLRSPTGATVFTPQGPVVLDRVPRFPVSDSAAARGGLIAPMPGSVLKVLAEVGDVVVEGAPFAVLEAMKMEHTVVVPESGKVAEVLVTAGEQVEAGAMLARIEPAESP
jgi:acetyl/propionyl-CoA carboxylase alpha subunit